LNYINWSGFLVTAENT